MIVGALLIHIKEREMNRKQWWILGVVIFAGCLLRLIFCLASRYEVTPFDDLDYLRRGLFFSRGGSPGCWRAPMEGWLIGIAMRLFNYHFLPVRLSHTLISCALLPLVFLLARRFAGFNSSIIVTIITALWFEFFTYCILLLSEGVSMTLLAGAALVTILALDAVQKGKDGKQILWLGAGVLWGLAALARDEFFFTALGMLVPLWMALKSLKKALPWLCLLLLGLFLVILPYTIRNLITRKSFVLISNHGAYNLWQHWNNKIPGSEMNRQFFEWPEPEQQRRALNKAWECLRDDPRFVLTQSAKSFFRMWASDEMTNCIFYFGILTHGNRTIPVVLSILITFFLFILMAGFFIHLKNSWRDPATWVMYMVIFSSLFMHALAYGQGRYRVPWTPFIIICGVLGWKYIGENFQLRKKQMVIGIVSSLVLFSLGALVIGKSQVRTHQINIKESSEKRDEKRYLKEMRYHFGTLASIFRQRQDKITPLLPQEKNLKEK